MPRLAQQAVTIASQEDLARNPRRYASEGEKTAVGETAILSLATAEQTVATGAGLLAIYSAGLGISFLIAAFRIEQFSAVFSRMKRHLATVEHAMRVLLVVT